MAYDIWDKLSWQESVAPSTDKEYYLASAYSHSDPAVKRQRYHDVHKIGADLIKLGYLLLEPIASCAYKERHFSLPSSYDYYKRRDRKMIDLCNGGLILAGDIWGYTVSLGVSDEVEYTLSLGKPVFVYAKGKWYQLVYKQSMNGIFE